MLYELHVENFVLIDSLKLMFGPGLTVFTGETGAGKSILLEAVSLLSGGRGFGELVRTGTTEAVIEGAFRITNLTEAQDFLKMKGLIGASEELILSRRIQTNGPNRCWVNGHLTTLADLTELGSMLMDIQSQGEHYSLLSPKQHLRILDCYAGSQVIALKAEYQKNYRRYKELQTELAELTRSEQERLRQIDMLQFQIQEINDANLREGEDQELLERRNILRNAEKLAAESARAFGLMKEGFAQVPGALDSLQEAAACLERVARIDSGWNESVNDMAHFLSGLEELTDRLRSYLEKLDYDSSELDKLEMRLVLLENLKHKYGPEFADVLSYLQKAQQQLAYLKDSECRRDKLDTEIEHVAQVAETLGLRLRGLREEAAKRLKAEVEESLAELRLTDARLEVAVEPLASGDRFGEDGLDMVEFLFSANPGEPLRPLQKAASGGELSRLLLAFKGALAAAEGVPILIFDEIDTGTSGRTAQAIAERLDRLAQNYQVFAVTHLPQIAAMGDHHYLLEKEIDLEGNTRIKVKLLDRQGRINELARLLGGITVTEATLKAASDLLLQVEKYKNKS